MLIREMINSFISYKDIDERDITRTDNNLGGIYIRDREKGMEKTMKCKKHG